MDALMKGAGWGEASTLNRPGQLKVYPGTQEPTPLASGTLGSLDVRALSGDAGLNRPNLRGHCSWIHLGDRERGLSDQAQPPLSALQAEVGTRD